MTLDINDEHRWGRETNFSQNQQPTPTAIYPFVTCSAHAKHDGQDGQPPGFLRLFPILWPFMQHRGEGERPHQDQNGVAPDTSLRLFSLQATLGHGHLDNPFERSTLPTHHPLAPLLHPGFCTGAGLFGKLAAGAMFAYVDPVYHPSPSPSSSLSVGLVPGHS